MPFQFRKEAIEEELNSNFPSQGQGNPPLYYSLSEVVVPTYSINSVAEGSGLPVNLQTALDFSVSEAVANNNIVTLANTPGFYLVNASFSFDGSATATGRIQITDGTPTTKVIYRVTGYSGTDISTTPNTFVVFLRALDVLQMESDAASCISAGFARQIADVNGNLVNPLGFSFA